ncbi:MAG: hypothetical protein JW987_16275 [Anaerolineaceae bacterium]|nr:hypothetical protein [Anaerolineaceae bacterium]
MLKSHIDAVEEHLLAISQIPANTGHALHKGTPREAFIKEFLANHLSERVAIGTGEIIDANSRPNEPRNQIDIVIYKRDYPKLDFGGGISGFLAESVIATIEVKSTLDKGGIRQSVRTARKIKQLRKSIVQPFSAGYQPPSILSYVVAYDGPVEMQTVHKWVTSTHDSDGIAYPAMGNTADARVQTASPSLDAVIVLGKGFMHFDNTPLDFLSDEIRAQHPETKWIIADTTKGSLFLLFIFITQAVSGVSGSWLDLGPYLESFAIPFTSIRIGE